MSTASTPFSCWCCQSTDGRSLRTAYHFDYGYDQFCDACLARFGDRVATPLRETVTQNGTTLTLIASTASSTYRGPCASCHHYPSSVRGDPVYQVEQTDPPYRPWRSGHLDLVHPECVSAYLRNPHPRPAPTEPMAERAFTANTRALLHPIRIGEPADPAQLPAIEVAGVLVFVYVDSTGELVVSVDYDTADTHQFPEWAEQVPIVAHGVPLPSINTTRDTRLPVSEPKALIDNLTDDQETQLREMVHDAATELASKMINEGRAFTILNEICGRTRNDIFRELFTYAEPSEP